MLHIYPPKSIAPQYSTVRLQTLHSAEEMVSTVFVVITMGTLIDTDPAETAISPGPMWKALFVDSGMKYIYSSMHNRSTDLVSHQN